MYWRVRKLSVDQIAKQYWVHAVCLGSIVFNILLLATRPAIPKVDAQTKANFDQFVRGVTQHLLDTSYISYKHSTDCLRTELIPPLLARLQQQELMPKTMDELNATAKMLEEQREVCSVFIRDVRPGDLDRNGMMPFTVTGVYAKHSATESGPGGPVPFAFKFAVGQKPAPEGEPSSPVIADFQDISPQVQQ